ncbi:MAG: hypothetical protein GY868_20665, partial [Deltaproteobacteria bacterium]|nr:hypothetical protein [Deltaproteobacteria bacterium]
CDFTGDGQKLTMLMYDITDRENPVLLREIRFSGSYLNSRRIERAVHSVVLYPVVVSQPDMQYTPELVNQCPEYEPTPDEPTLAEIIAAFDTLKQYNRDIINNSAPEDWLPAIEDIRYDDNGSTTTGTQLLDCAAIYEDGQKSRQSYLTVVSFDIDELEELSQSTVLGKPGAVYASDSALFIANRQESSSGYNWYFDEAAMLSDATTVHKFNLYSDPATSAYVASGVVKGRVLNQFSIDEQDGYLRLATTTGHLPDPRTHNSLVILQDTGSALTTVGQIDNIAPTEDIRSVRFADDRAFMVTFKKTDPLFCFDLSDPLQPRIEGELKIPGYSTYIHMLDEDHLLTIGYDADDAGERAYFQGIMLQLFDVSSMRNPFLMHKEIIGSRGTSSEAATDHLAFNYFTPRQALAIPITICEGGEGGSGYGYDMSFSGLLVYRVSIQDGFTELGGISHVSEDAFNSYYSPCGGWWTDSNSIVKRSIFMDDYVYSVAMDQILIHHLDRIGEEVTGVDLTGSP